MPLVSQTAEYALRAMTVIAGQPPDAGIRARDLAVATHVPADYLSKILRRLVLAGLLDAQRGHGGGFTLAKPAERITFHDIFEALDDEPDPDHCAFGFAQCNKRKPCPLHDAWSEAKEAHLAWAKRMVLSQFVVATPPTGRPVKPQPQGAGRKPRDGKPQRPTRPGKPKASSRGAGHPAFDDDTATRPSAASAPGPTDPAALI